MISLVLQIIAFALPWIGSLFTAESKAQRRNDDFDKALATGNTADISRLLSERYDSMRSKDSGDSRLKGINKSG